MKKEYNSQNNKKGFYYQYEHPAVTTDSVVFGFDGNDLFLLLIKRGIEPDKGKWALPGGFINLKINETLEECAARELKEETNVDISFQEQFHAFGDPNRDPRERVITIAFLALVRKNDYIARGGDDASDAQWFNVNSTPELAFDHKKIIEKAKICLQEKLRIKPIAFKMLGKSFKMSELQKVYELVNETKYDRRNFARKMLASGFIKECDKQSSTTDSNDSMGKGPTPTLLYFDEKAYNELKEKEKEEKENHIFENRKYPFDF